jgi:hypothetical protein
MWSGAVAVAAGLAVGLIALRRRRAELERIVAAEREWELAEKPTLRAFGDEIWDCGCADLYFCPASEELACPRHSGFGVCCASPEAHVLVRPLLPESQVESARVVYR